MPENYPQPSPEYWWKCIHCGHEWPLINPFDRPNGTQCRMKNCPAMLNKNLIAKSNKIWQ